MSDRGERLLVLLAEAQIDLLLVSGLVNVRYLTGYTGSNGLAVVGPQTRVFVTDFRYVEQAREEVDSRYDRRQEANDLMRALPEVLPPGSIRLGFDDAQLSVRQHAELRELLPERIELVAAGGLVERLRAIKDAGEVEQIRAASAAADAALTELLAAGLAGRSERELAGALTAAMRAQGAQDVSFAPIVAAGAHGALPHAHPRDVAVAPGQLVVIDWGAELDGYCSDCTRTLAVGEPDGRAREIYALVLAAQRAGLEAVRAGAGGRAVDATARAVIDAAGHGGHFGHGLGHGVGLEVHEAPRLSKRSDDELAAGHVVTVEPGVYLPGELGVRIEDLVVVTDTGNEILSGLDTQLTIVG
ncbi:MAG: Xaa-Pro aminopeptidase [Solirubrobacteraceae bacterium]|jgi:Xaa-Pro aminopeptidase|nr:Xaa-Pro aminopeptidase [Solirubrobacteraceae bacterium]